MIKPVTISWIQFARPIWEQPHRILLEMSLIRAGGAESAAERRLTCTERIDNICMEGAPMRTTIDINEDLLREAERLTTIKMKRKLVDTALQELIRQARLRQLAGMLGATRLNLTQRSLRRMRSDG